jgi:peptidoglycan LD-endopeptidase LytH
MKRLLLPFPVMGPEFPPEKLKKVDLSTDRTGPVVEDPYDGLKYWVDLTSENGKYCCYGGYLEKRGIYTAEHYLKNPRSVRNIHIGVDVWWRVGTPVFAPYDGRVHSFAYNDKPLDYGGTIILEHILGSDPFYTLYGHLSKASLSRLEEGMEIKRGEVLGHLGDREENGGWYPHLHLQLIKSMGNFSGDYPGVVALKNKRIIENCPNPDFMVKAG